MPAKLYQTAMFSVFGNSTNIVFWVDDPHRRGTLEVLSSCIVTTFLCVWTALHLNLPCHKDVRQPWYAQDQLWRKIGWLILTLLAPEMTVYAAWAQYREARGVKDLKIKVSKGARSETVHSQIHLEDGARLKSDCEEWGMTHGFYTVMGGFVLEMESEESFLPAHRKRMTLTAKGIQHVAERFPSLLPNISEVDIADKSKAGALAKSIVCIQTIWFISQCISRMAMDLPITLLELNTLGHGVCALVIYIFWWKKPLDVDQPIPIKGKQADQLLAFFWMTTDGLPVAYRRDNKDKAEVRYLGFFSDEEEQPSAEQIRNGRNDKTIPKTVGQVYRPSVVPELVKMLPSYQPPWKSRLAKETSTSIKLARGMKLESTNIRNESEDVLLALEDARRWQLAESLLTENLQGRSDDDWQATITDRSRNWPAIDFDPKNIDWRLLGALNASGILYGGLHLLAWNAQFSTAKQKGLWRLAALIIMTFMPASNVVLLTENLMFWAIDAKMVGHRLIEGFYKSLYQLKFAQICFLLGLLTYLLARVYLVVECFISLFHSPDEVYDLPKWSAYVPHII